MADIENIIKHAGHIDPETAEVGLWMYNPEVDFKVIGKDWAKNYWYCQEAKIFLPESLTEEEIMAQIAEHRAVLNGSPRFLGPAFNIIEGDNREGGTKSECVLDEGVIGVWGKLRSVEPADRVLWSTVTIRRLSNMQILFGQASLDGQEVTGSQHLRPITS